jgi:hypothetical protein
MAKIQPSTIINVVRSWVCANSVPFEEALDEIDKDDVGVGDTGVGVEEVGMEEVGMEEVGMEEVGMEEVGMEEVGMEGVGIEGVGMEGVAGVEIGVEVRKRLSWFIGWLVALTLPISLDFVVGVCHKMSVEDEGDFWGRIVRVRVRLFVLICVAGLWTYLAEDMSPKTVIVVCRVAVLVIVVVIAVVLTGLLLGIIACISYLAALPAARTQP